MKAGMKYAAGAAVGRALIESILRSCRWEVRGEESFRRYLEQGRQVIFTLWHGRLLPLTFHHRGQGISTLISRSGDGEYIARIAEAWGYETGARGSSHRGGTEALRELMRAARKGNSLAFTPDGPRGPRQKMKPGAVAAAQMTGLPLIPMAAGADRAWWPEGWDRFLVPKPFARIHVRYGTPFEVPRAASPEELARITAAVEAELDRVTAEADEAAAGG